eukprot:gene3327-2309_t
MQSNVCIKSNSLRTFTNKSKQLAHLHIKMHTAISHENYKQPIYTFACAAKLFRQLQTINHAKTRNIRKLINASNPYSTYRLKVTLKTTSYKSKTN